MSVKSHHLVKNLTRQICRLPIYTFLVVVMTLPCIASELDTDKKPDAPWRIIADQIQYDKKTKTYTAEGNVLLKQINRKITADRIIYNTETRKAYAIGNAVVTAGKDILSGERIEMDLSDETGIVHDGNVFFEARHFHIRGDEIRKTGLETYAAKWASLTSCDGESPDWKVTGRDINLTMEGYATAWHTIFWLKRVPVLYSPYFIIPVKQERQSGLLRPEFSLGSDRKGFAYNQPLFWAISPSTDATFYWDYMEKRGNKWGSEFRYVLGPWSKGTAMFDYLNDQQIDDGTGDSSDKWGYTDDEYLRTNRDRYWFRMKHDQGTLPWGFTGRVDLDVVSDQDYLREFRRGLTGFNVSDTYFSRYFGRDLDDYDDNIRRNIVNLTRNWSKYRINTGATWFDNVIRRRHKNLDFTIQPLPWINFSGSKQKVFQTPFFYSLNTGYTHFYRQDGDKNNNITGLHHTNLYPRVFLPVRAGRFFTIEPSAGWRYNYWNISSFEQDDPDQETSIDRNIYDLGLGFGSEVFRIYNIGGTRIEKIKNSIRPKITYVYFPEVDQDDIPDIDEIEPIDEKSVVTYSLTSTFTSKLKRIGIAKSSESDSRDIENISVNDEGTPLDDESISLNDENIPAEDESISVDDEDIPQHEYHDFLRFFLKQSYDFNEASDDEIEDPEPLSPLFGEIRFFPSRYLWSLASMKWDVYENRSVEKRLEAIMRDKRGDYFRARYRVRENEDDEDDEDNQIETLNFLMRVAITNRLSAHARYEQDLVNEENVSRGLGWQYRTECWTFAFDFLEEAEDRRYSFSIFLHGLGGFKHSISENLESEY